MINPVPKWRFNNSVSLAIVSALCVLIEYKVKLKEGNMKYLKNQTKEQLKSCFDDGLDKAASYLQGKHENVEGSEREIYIALGGHYKKGAVAYVKQFVGGSISLPDLVMFSCTHMIVNLHPKLIHFTP